MGGYNGLATAKSELEAMRADALKVLEALDSAIVKLGGHSIMRASADLRRRNGKPSRVDIVAVVLREHGMPLPGSALMEAVEAQGIDLGHTANRQINFSSALSKSGAFTSHLKDRRYYWWFAGEPLPVGFSPAQQPSEPTAT